MNVLHKQAAWEFTKMQKRFPTPPFTTKNLMDTEIVNLCYELDLVRSRM